MKKYLLIPLFFLVLPSVSFAADCAGFYAASPSDAEWGDTTSQQQLGQPFTVSSNCLLGAVGAYAHTVGSPSDNAVLSVYSGASSPTTLIETGTTPVWGASYGWATSTFAGTHTLVSGTQYWVVWSRSGSLSNTNLWYNAVKTGGSYGDAKVYNGSVWNTLSAGSEAYFEIAPATGGGGGGAEYTVFDEIFGSATTSASTTLSIVDNPTQDLFYGYTVFFMTFIGVVWLMRKH